MDQVTLTARRRTEFGTRPSRRSRRDGDVPAIVYGRGLDPLSVLVSRKELHSALRTESGLNAILSLEIEGGDKVLAVARELQRHPVRGEITHLDLIKVSLDVAITAEVGLELLGTPTQVSEDGAIVEQIQATVVLSALPTAIPSSIPLDISGLQLGETLKVEDLPEIDGVTYSDDPEAPLVTLILPRAEVAAEAEGEEGEAGDAADEAQSGAEDGES